MVFMAENTLEFVQKLQWHLKRNHITYHSYLQGISDGVICVDRFIVSAISMMWNISISVVSPVYSREWKIHHNATEADILIVSNGHQLGHAKEATQLFSNRKYIEKLEESWTRCSGFISKNNRRRIKR